MSLLRFNDSIIRTDAFFVLLQYMSLEVACLPLGCVAGRSLVFVSTFVCFNMIPWEVIKGMKGDTKQAKTEKSTTEVLERKRDKTLSLSSLYPGNPQSLTPELPLLAGLPHYKAELFPSSQISILVLRYLLTFLGIVIVVFAFISKEKYLGTRLFRKLDTCSFEVVGLMEREIPVSLS